MIQLKAVLQEFYETGYYKSKSEAEQIQRKLEENLAAVPPAELKSYKLGSVTK
jgi:hypothetical protein